MIFLNKIFNFLKKRKYIYGVISVFLIVGGIFIFKNGKVTDETILISHADFINQISVSGKVVATEDVDLAFKNGGIIKRVYFSVGQGVGKEDVVKSGALIVALDAKDAEKDVHDAEISLESAKLALAKIELENSDENLSADLAKAYDDGFSAASEAFVDLSTTLSGLDDILSQNNVSNNAARTNGKTALLYREEADKKYYEAHNAFEKNKKEFRLLERNSPKPEIESIINKIYETARIFSDAIKSTKNLVDYLADGSNTASGFTSYKDTLSLYTNTIGGHLSSLLSIKTSIKNYKDAFGSISLDRQDSLLLIKQKENALEDAKNKLSDYYIRAPFDGIITNIDARVGEVAISNTPLVTMMSADTFQIESFVPEVNIAQIKLGDEANVTLDAYGESVLFNAKVVSIDPAETIRDGVSTYKIKLQFLGKDNRIKSGMTANVSIVTFSKLNSISIPGGVIFDKNGKKFVQVKIGEKINDKEVILGNISSLGQTEIISGLEDGDIVILNPSLVK
jgi:HlyD family secretion protein